MDKLDWLLLPPCDAFHVHQAGRVGTGDILGTCGHVALDLILTHAYRHVGLFHREHTAEAAALVHALRLFDGDAVFELQQIDDLVISMILLYFGMLRSDGDDSPNSRTPWQLLCTLTT